MKRILIFSLAYYPSFVSGAEAAIKEITDRIAPDDIEFHMVTHLFDRNAPREELIGNVHVHRIGFGGTYLSKIFFVPLAALKARALHNKLRFDVLWAMMTYMLFPTVLAKAFGVRAPHILTLQDGDPYEKVFGRWFILPVAPLLNYGFRTASVIQVISQYLATWPTRRGYKGKIVLVKNGANPNDLKQAFSQAEIAKIANELGKKEGEIFLVNTSRLVHQKGIDTTIEALQYLPKNVKFIAVGAGADEEKLKELTKRLGLTDRVVFTGQVDRAIVTLYRKSCDIFVAPSRSEGLGNAFVSALASKLPLVTSGVGGIADYAIDGETAWIVPPNDPQALAGKIKEVIANPEKARKISERARAMVERDYDWDKIARQMRAYVFGMVCT
ncbi:MAG: glycosyltransferase family 4 protein [Patescibacteria group bacterium]|nr:glycosyltransferase family 4 protein [Patescibacteria group bacterium]